MSQPYLYATVMIDRDGRFWFHPKCLDDLAKFCKANAIAISGVSVSHVEGRPAQHRGWVCVPCSGFRFTAPDSEVPGFTGAANDPAGRQDLPVV